MSIPISMSKAVSPNPNYTTTIADKGYNKYHASARKKDSQGIIVGRLEGVVNDYNGLHSAMLALRPEKDAMIGKGTSIKAGMMALDGVVSFFANKFGGYFQSVLNYASNFYNQKPV